MSYVQTRPCYTPCYTLTVVSVDIHMEDGSPLPELVGAGQSVRLYACSSPWRSSGFAWSAGPGLAAYAVPGSFECFAVVAAGQAPSAEEGEAEVGVDFTLDGTGAGAHAVRRMTVVSPTHLTVADADSGRSVTDTTLTEEGAGPGNTLHVAERADGTAGIGLSIGRGPGAFEPYRYRWKVEAAGAGGGAGQWGCAGAAFGLGVTASATWTRSAGSANGREFKVTCWFDVNGNGYCDYDEPTRSAYVTILSSVDFLDASKNPVSTLKVGKWENAFNAGPTVKDNFIDLDPDRFHVRVNDQSKKGSGKVSVKLSTDSDGTAYDDDATEIELDEESTNSGIFISTNMLMVSDDMDDDFTNPNVVADDNKNDRTHKIALGGKVKVQYPETGTVICEKEASVPPALKTVQVSIVVLNIGGSPVTPLATVSNAWLIAKERYAQIGINLEYTITAANQPTGVDLSDGLDVASASAPTWTQVAQESKDLISALGTTNTTADIHAFYVNVINAFGRTDSRGVAIARYWFTDPSATPCYYNFMVASTAGPFTAPHELGHLLDNSPVHHSDAWNLMRSGTSTANGVTESKRLDANQESTMRGDSHAQ